MEQDVHTRLSTGFLIDLPAQWLQALRAGSQTDALERQLAALQVEALLQALPHDGYKLAFWINMYNAACQWLATRHGLTPPGIFTVRKLCIAGHLFSLDAIEHGILRRYRWKYSLGYLPDVCAAPLIKKLAVVHPDYRIHFALNCGATSCPPIALYRQPQLDAQLNLAAMHFIERQTTIQQDTRTLLVSRIFLWYLADFGGLRGMRKLHEKMLQQSFKHYRLQFKPYDWTPVYGNYSPYMDG